MSDKNTHEITEVSRIEVTDEVGRRYTNWSVDIVRISVSEDGTLKIFVKDKKEGKGDEARIK